LFPLVNYFIKIFPTVNFSFDFVKILLYNQEIKEAIQLNEFSRRMKELRVEKGLKKVDVANGTDLSRSAITKYESGERDNPTRDILKQIADFYNVSMDYLAGQSDIRDKEISNKTLSDIFSALSDSGKIELVKYAKYLKEQENNG
jgi:transcriptional regulator with XRE-family HTH domain